MAFFQFLGHIVATALIGYLSFTNFLADTITQLIPGNEAPELSQLPSEFQLNKKSELNVSEELISLSKQLSKAFNEKVPRVLLENQEFQEAALGASAIPSPSTINSLALSPAELIEHSLVNIFCQYKTDRYIRTTTGTGFFIDEKGVILTNAHVAQFLLLKSRESNIIDTGCVIRAGNPALPKYTAELLYISPIWIYQNAELITEETPMGTGERDYALLYVSGPVGSTPLPKTFPAIPVDTALLSIYTKGSSILTAGYPAEALFREGANAKLEPVVASTTIGDLYTFGSNYADIFSVSESPVGEQGASGGPIVNAKGNAIGVIVTKGDETTEGKLSLRAISLSYVDRTITEETGYSLLQNMKGDLQYRGEVFRKALIPFLSDLLTSQLKNKDLLNTND